MLIFNRGRPKLYGLTLLYFVTTCLLITDQDVFRKGKAIDYILNKGQIGIFNCYMGLTFFCAPLMVDGKIKGIFYGGGFCSEDNKKAFKGGTIYDIPIIETKKIQELANFMGILIDLLDHKINTDEKKDHDNFKNIIFLQKKLSPEK